MITPEVLQKHTRAGDADASYVAQLEEGAVAFMEGETGRYFGAVASFTEYVIGNGTPRLHCSETPGGTLVVKEAANPGATQTTITAADADGFLVRGRQLVRKNGYAWARGYEYELTYDRGYAAGSEPTDIYRAVLELVALWYERRMPLPKIGEVHSFPVPFSARATIERWKRGRV